jgi:hypothetical protein
MYGHAMPPLLGPVFSLVPHVDVNGSHDVFDLWATRGSELVETPSTLFVRSLSTLELRCGWRIELLTRPECCIRETFDETALENLVRGFRVPTLSLSSGRPVSIASVVRRIAASSQTATSIVAKSIKSGRNPSRGARDRPGAQKRKPGAGEAPQRRCRGPPEYRVHAGDFGGGSG